MKRSVWGLAAAGLWLLLGPAAAAAEVAFDPVYSVGGYGIGRERFDGPVDVVEDRDETIYVVDRGNNRIQVLDRRGRFLREWGGRGFAPGSFDSPSAIALDPVSGTLLVVDTLNHRVQRFDTSGKFLGSFGRLGSRDGDFNAPRDIAVDRKGNIYVADTGNNRIQKFDPSGRFLAAWGKFERRRGVQLENPVSVAYSDEGFGHIFALTSPDCRVQKFDIDGNLVAEWTMHRRGEGALCGPSRIRVEPRRYTVYIADTENDRVILFDKNGEPLGDLRGDGTPFRKPAGVSVVQTFGEYVLVADTGNNLIQKFRRVR